MGNAFACTAGFRTTAIEPIARGLFTINARNADSAKSWKSLPEKKCDTVSHLIDTMTIAPSPAELVDLAHPVFDSLEHAYPLNLAGKTSCHVRMAWATHIRKLCVFRQASEGRWVPVAGDDGRAITLDVSPGKEYELPEAALGQIVKLVADHGDFVQIRISPR